MAEAAGCGKTICQFFVVVTTKQFLHSVRTSSIVSLVIGQHI
jgi:hypothetical protein